MGMRFGLSKGKVLTNKYLKKAMGFLQILGLLLTITFMKGCGVTDNNQSAKRIQGVTVPFYKTTTLQLPISTDLKNQRDSLDHVLYAAHLRLLRKLMNGELKGYEDPALSHSYSAKKVRSRARVEGYSETEGSFDDPQFRKNFIQNIDRQRFHKYTLTLRWKWKADQQKGEVKLLSLTPYYRPNVSGTSIGEQPLASVSYESLINKLQPNLKQTLQDKLKEYLFNHLQQSRVNDVPLAYKGQSLDQANDVIKRPLHFRSDSAFKGTLGRQFADYHKEILKGSRNGGINVYKSDSLNETYQSAKAVKRLGADKKTIKVAKGTGDKQFFSDTTIYDQLNASQFKRYWLIERWKKVETGLFELNPIALSPVYRPVRGGVQLGGVSLFWLKMNDLDNVLKPAETRWLKAYSYLKVQRQLADQGYSLP